MAFFPVIIVHVLDAAFEVETTIAVCGKRHSETDRERETMKDESLEDSAEKG
jgi:hypothetical protein